VQRRKFDFVKKSINFSSQPVRGRENKLLGGNILTPSKINQSIIFFTSIGPEPQILDNISHESSLLITPGQTIRVYAWASSSLGISIFPSRILNPLYLVPGWGGGIYQEQGGVGGIGSLNFFDSYRNRFYARITFTGFTEPRQYNLSISQNGNNIFNGANTILTIYVNNLNPPTCGAAIGGGGV